MRDAAAVRTEPIRRLRIAVFNRIFATQGGGAERYSIALVEQLALRHEIHVFAQTIQHDFPGVTYHKVSAPFKKPRWINQLWYATVTWWATRRGFDLIHSHENTWHGQVQTVHVLPVKHNLFKERVHGWRWVLRCLKVGTSPRLLVYLALEHVRFAQQRGRQVVVTSQSLAAILAQTYPNSRPMLSVVTPGVATVPGSAGEAQKRMSRSALGLPIQGPCLLFVGNDYRKKGLQTVLDALAVLGPDVFLAVVGHPGQQPDFQSRALAAGVGQRVFFLGALENMPTAYQAADILVHPTLEDTFAMVVLEAMAHGVPVVVSGPTYCGIAGMLKDGVDACILQDPRDAFGLHTAVQRLLSDTYLRQRITDAALQFAKAHQWQTLVSRQEQIYAVALKEMG